MSGLIITDLAGCKDTLIRPQYIRVNGPSASFTSAVAGTCFNSSVLFSDNSTTDGVNPIVRWIWNYGDGVIDTLTAGPFQHTYVNPGLYTVRLMVTDASGCSDGRTRPNMITISRPQANFRTADTSTCPNRTVTFVNTSTGPGLYLSLELWRWQYKHGGGPGTQLPGKRHLFGETCYNRSIRMPRFSDAQQLCNRSLSAGTLYR